MADNKNRINNLMNNLRILNNHFNTIDFDNIEYIELEKIRENKEINNNNNLNILYEKNKYLIELFYEVYNDEPDINIKDKINKTNLQFINNFIDNFIGIYSLDVYNIHLHKQNIKLELSLLQNNTNNVDETIDENYNNKEYTIVYYLKSMLNGLTDYVLNQIQNYFNNDKNIQNKIDNNNKIIQLNTKEINNNLDTLQQILSLYENKKIEEFEQNKESYTIDKLHNSKIKKVYEHVSSYKNINKELLIYILLKIESFDRDYNEYERKSFINVDKLEEHNKIRLEYNLRIGKELFNEDYDYVSYGNMVLKELDEVWNLIKDDKNYKSEINEIHNILCNLYLLYFVDFKNYKNDTIINNYDNNYLIDFINNYTTFINELKQDEIDYDNITINDYDNYTN